MTPDDPGKAEHTIGRVEGRKFELCSRHNSRKGPGSSGNAGMGFLVVSAFTHPARTVDALVLIPGFVSADVVGDGRRRDGRVCRTRRAWGGDLCAARFVWPASLLDRPCGCPWPDMLCRWVSDVRCVLAPWAWVRLRVVLDGAGVAEAGGRAGL